MNKKLKVYEDGKGKYIQIRETKDFKIPFNEFELLNEEKKLVLREVQNG